MEAQLDRVTKLYEQRQQEMKNDMVKIQDLTNKVEDMAKAAQESERAAMASQIAAQQSNISAEVNAETAAGKAEEARNASAIAKKAEENAEEAANEAAEQAARASSGGNVPPVQAAAVLPVVEGEAIKSEEPRVPSGPPADQEQFDVFQALTSAQEEADRALADARKQGEEEQKEEREEEEADRALADAQEQEEEDEGFNMPSGSEIVPLQPPTGQEELPGIVAIPTDEGRVGTKRQKSEKSEINFAGENIEAFEGTTDPEEQERDRQRKLSKEKAARDAQEEADRLAKAAADAQEMLNAAPEEEEGRPAPKRQRTSADREIASQTRLGPQTRSQRGERIRKPPQRFDPVTGEGVAEENDKNSLCECEGGGAMQTATIMEGAGLLDSAYRQPDQVGLPYIVSSDGIDQEIKSLVYDRASHLRERSANMQEDPVPKYSRVAV